MKPVGLIEKMLKASARSGDIVIDGFGGSGSTLIAADRMGMSARLMELEPRFVDVIVRRWQEFTGRQATRQSDGMVFDGDAGGAGSGASVSDEAVLEQATLAAAAGAGAASDALSQ